MLVFPRNLYLTFDVEDFVDDRSLAFLPVILALHERTRPDGIFSS
jgi:hypothetical protein